MKNNNQNIHDSINWSPEIIVDLIGEIAWPLVILIIFWKFKESIMSGLKNFFENNNPIEVTVGAGGVSAKFETSKQTESAKLPMPLDPLPEGQNAESIKKLHTERSTLYSLEVLDRVKNHLSQLTINDQEKVELLSTEVSILQSYLQYIDITTVLFLSQYDLFNKYFYPQNIVTHEEIQNYFNDVKSLHQEAYENWDLEKYIAYPIAAHLIMKCEEGYKLTNLGTSYVMHIRNNPGFLDYLAKI